MQLRNKSAQCIVQCTKQPHIPLLLIKAQETCKCVLFFLMFSNTCGTPIPRTRRQSGVAAALRKSTARERKAAASETPLVARLLEPSVTSFGSELSSYGGRGGWTLEASSLLG